MNDVFVEQIIERRPSKFAGIIKVLLILLCVFSLVMILLPYGIGLIAIAGVIGFTVITIRNFDVEYEYSFVEGELDVDRIVCKSSRKRCGSFDFRKLECMAPEGSQSDLRLIHKQYKEFDFSSNDPNNPKQVAYVMRDNEIVRLIFEPNEEMISAIQYISHGKVFQD